MLLMVAPLLVSLLLVVPVRMLPLFCAAGCLHDPPPVLRSGNTNTLALPATSLWVLILTAATVGSMAASYWMGPSTCGLREKLRPDLVRSDQIAVGQNTEDHSEVMGGCLSAQLLGAQTASSGCCQMAAHSTH